MSIFLFSCTDVGPDGPKVSPQPEKKISSITFYFDGSESNHGYYHSGSKFGSVIAPMLERTVKDFSTTRIKFIDDDTIKVYGEGKEGCTRFIDELGTVKNNTGKSSSIHEFFGRIMNLTDSSGISLLISDCILSYPDSVIKKDTTGNKNKNDADGNILKAKTMNAISGEFASNKRINYHPAFSVYAYLSDFTGFYFNYKNIKSKQNLNNRPYYIWVLSKDKDLLQKFEEQVMSAKDLKPEGEMHFGIVQNGHQNFTILPRLRRYGQWNPDKNKALRNIDINAKKDKVVFTLCVDLPMLKNDSLGKLNNLVKTRSSNNCKFIAQFLNRSNIRQEEINDLGDDNLKHVYGTTSHLMQVTINEMLTESDTLFITLPFTYPAWYSSWSTHDDMNVNLIQNKTFAIDQIIMAFMETMQDDKKNIIDIKIPIRK